VVKRVLIIGGYGNFGSYISRSLAAEPGIQLLIAGRSLDKASRFVSQLRAAAEPEPIALDISADITATLAATRPDILIHTTGPFQTQGYAVAQACLRQGCHYIDLADARGFVAGIGRFDQEAREKGLLIVSGASSVPCLTADLELFPERYAGLRTLRFAAGTEIGLLHVVYRAPDTTAWRSRRDSS
jgi:short subunit dehydrogenase-like uncharacterized protein